MRDSVPSASYSSVCNVLRQWSISLIPTYRVYRLYDREYFSTLDSLPVALCSDVMYTNNHVHRALLEDRKEKEREKETMYIYI